MSCSIAALDLAVAATSLASFFMVVWGQRSTAVAQQQQQGKTESPPAVQVIHTIDIGHTHDAAKVFIFDVVLWDIMTGQLLIVWLLV